MSSSNDSFNLTISYKLVALVLLLANIATIAIWQPWSSSSSETKRTISVSGTTTISAEPDEFMFNPSYSFTADSSEEIVQLVAAKSTEVTEGLKEIGVQDADIKVNAGSYDYWYYDEDEETTRGSLTMTVTVDNREFAQTVQDYLTTTSPEGSITPYAQFSSSKQKELESRARTEAVADAKKSAEETAATLDADLGKVVSVEDTSSGGYPWFGIAESRAATLDAAVAEPSIPVQPGENELTFTVQATFELK